jgi:uroporphyrinogen III methyltransferase/synthase
MKNLEDNNTLWPSQSRSQNAALPLAGRTIVVTRPQDRANEMANAIVALGGEPMICPMVEVRPLPIRKENPGLLDNLQRFEWLIFTSANAVEAFHGLLKENRTASLPASLRIITVGKKTADAVREMGWCVEAIGEQTSAEGVVATLLQRGVGRSTSILFPRALEGREIIPQELAKIGANIVVLPVYQTVPVIPKDFDELRARLRERTIDAITFTSPSAVKQYFRLFPVKEWPVSHEICLAAIGQTTAAAIIEHGLRVNVIPETASAVEMVEGIAEYFKVGETKFVASSTT